MKLYLANDINMTKLGYGCTLRSYPHHFANMDIAIAEINGKYPDPGYIINHNIDELIFIKEGSGTIFLNQQAIRLNQHDVIIIEAGDKYFWQGAMTLIIVCNPAFDPNQQEIIYY